jgi:hypothetical protein
MNKFPNPFWAAIFIILACVLAVTALFSPVKDNNAIQQVLTLAASIVTGAFGYIQGVKDGAASISVPSQSSPGSATTVTMGPIQAETPPQPQPKQ